MKSGILKIGEIDIDEKLYPRIEVNEGIVKEYAQAMDSGSVFPPIYVALYKKKYVLVDGKHRIDANSMRGEKYINCEIQSNFPNRDSIYIAAVKANLKHGTRLRNKDKVKIGYTLKEMGYETEDIIKLTGLSVQTVEKVILPKMTKLSVTASIKKGRFPRVIKDAVKPSDIRPIMTTQEEKYIKEVHQAEWQINELGKFLEYIKTEKLDTENKKVCNLVGRIKKWLKKRYPKL